MSMFENWILGRAKKIEERQEKQRKSKLSPVSSFHELRTKVLEYAKQLEAEIVPNMKPKWKTGDILILDVFFVNPLEQLRSWDGGANVLINCIQPNELNTVPTVSVRKVEIATLLFYEKVDKFTEYMSEDEALDVVNSYESFKILFRSYIDKFALSSCINTEVKENFLLYFDVMFDPVSFSFAPNWGLSEYSWIDSTTRNAKKVKSIWEKKRKLMSNLEMTRNKMQELTKKIETLEQELEW